MSIITLFEELLNLSVRGSLLIIVIMGFRLFFRNDFSAKWLYNIWLFVVIRFVIPILPTPTSNLFSIYNFFLMKIYKFEGEDILLGNLGSQLDSFQAVGTQVSIPDVIEDTLSLNWNYYGSIIWIIGMVVLLITFFLISYKMLRALRSSNKCVDKNLLQPLEEYKKITSYNRTVNIYISSQFSTPMTWGIRSPKIIIPEKILLHINQDDLKYILLHELIHIKRHDVLFTNLGLIICVINWYNPLVWLAFFRSKTDCELACDESVLGHLHKEEYKKYAHTIINMMKLVSIDHSANYILAKSLILNRSEANERITKVTRYHKKKMAIVVFSISLTIFIGLVGLNDTTSTKRGNIYSKHYLPSYISMKEDSLIKSMGQEPTEKYNFQNENSKYSILSYKILGDNVQFWFNGTKGRPDRRVIEITTEHYKGIKQGMPREKAEKVANSVFSGSISISRNDSLIGQKYRDNECIVTIFYDKKTNRVYSISLSGEDEK